MSAAAGSGKTAVLTERAVRLITDPEHPVDADRLLIVTFTNAAAAELRARIGQALLRRSQAEPGNTALRRQRMLLQRAPICTIDAFCLDLLHKHFQALDIPPDFTPADPGSVEMLRNAALSETLEAAYQDADFCAFADLYGKGRTDKAAGEAVLQVYDFLRALPDYDKKLDEMLAPWQDENGFARTCWHDILMQEAARSARAAKELLCAALNDCREDFVTAQADAEASKKTPAAKEKAVAAVNEKFAEPLERLENSAALLGEVERLAVAGEWTPLYDRLTPYVLGMEQAPGLKNMKKRLTGEHKDAVKTRADEAAKLFEKIEDLISCSLDEAELDRRAAEPCLRALFAAVRDFDARFAARKRERRLLEFSDFEHLALRLLRDADGQPTELCQGIRQGYAAVMVDEYQDTNFAQHSIVLQLTQEHQRVCVVGDDAQSIYSFRGANIDNILKFTQLYKGAKLFKLEQNYRSTQTIVCAANSLIEKNSEQIRKEVFSEKAKGEPIGVFNAYSDVEEGEIVANQIVKLRSREHYSYNDFAILYRTNAQSRIFEEALRKRALPYKIYGGLSFYQRKEIKDVISYFRLAVNPNDEEAFKRVLNYPARGIGDTTLNKVIDAAAQHHVSLWMVLEEPLAYGLNINKGMHTKLQGFRELVESFIVEVPKKNAYELGAMIVRQSGIMNEIYQSK